jgi:hypothetical protein
MTGENAESLDPISIDLDDACGGDADGRDALFGSDVGGSATQAQGDDANATGDAAAGTPSTAASAPAQSQSQRTRACTSVCWNDFEQLYKMVDGKRLRYAAKCNFCKKVLTATSGGGTGHLLRHQKACISKAARTAKTQSQSVLQFNSDGSVRNWEYNADVARMELCRLIARLDLPLGIGAYDAFVHFIQTAHNPRYVSVSRQTSTRDFVKLFNQSRTVLMECFKSCSSIAITSDIWNGNAKEDYLSVVAHYINSDWEPEKRLIGLKLIDVSHSGVNIAERISVVIDEWGLNDKIFSFTLDNASANTSAMDSLTPKFSGYIGSLFLHQRCACHIINLIVKSALKRFKPYIDAFRTAISFVNSSNQRIAAYKSYCIAMGVRPRKFGLDMDIRWNSTFLMLKHLIPYRSTFSVFIDTHYKQVTGQTLLTDDHWYVAEKILLFLELFYDSTVELSGVYYPTAPLMLHHIGSIAKHLKTYENDDLIGHAVIPMKQKFFKYWKKIPLLYSIAFILDPRCKMRGFNKVLNLLSQFTDVDYSNYYDNVRAELTRIFCKYETKFGAVRLQRQSQQASSVTGKKRLLFEMMYGDGSEVIEPSTSTAFESQGSELVTYLESETVHQYDDEFNILNWWQIHKRIYPVLSILVKDVMTVPVSTISSESTFSLAGRVIEERRRRLTSDMVEILSCLKDWELGAARAQHNLVDYEVENAFENLYLDED